MNGFLKQFTKAMVKSTLHVEFEELPIEVRCDAEGSLKSLAAGLAVFICISVEAIFAPFIIFFGGGILF